MNTIDSLLFHCTEMIATDGISAFSLRKLADRVGIKAPSIYVHFESKEALFSAARQNASDALRTALATDVEHQSVRQQLLASAAAYLQFALEQPHLFTLLMTQTESSRSALENEVDPDTPYTVLLSRVRALIGEKNNDAEPLCFGLWSLVHGAAVLRQSHLKAYSAVIPALTSKNIERLLDGWTSI
jgi:AcrR family transcriptional regulator